MLFCVPNLKFSKFKIILLGCLFGFSGTHLCRIFTLHGTVWVRSFGYALSMGFSGAKPPAFCLQVIAPVQTFSCFSHNQASLDYFLLSQNPFVLNLWKQHFVFSIQIRTGWNLFCNGRVTLGEFLWEIVRNRLGSNRPQSMLLCETCEAHHTFSHFSTVVGCVPKISSFQLYVGMVG